MVERDALERFKQLPSKTVLSAEHAIERISYIASYPIATPLPLIIVGRRRSFADRRYLAGQVPYVGKTLARCASPES